MKVVADLHLHSRFSRAVSQQMTIPEISKWAKIKGIDLVATGDWTHPVWYRELKASLLEKVEGLYQQKDGQANDPYFILSTELSSIYKFKGETRRVHYLVISPNLEVVAKINKEFTLRNINLLSDGRPIMGLPVKDVAQIVFETDPNCLIIPAHIWTPWFSLYGSRSGFNSIEECFGELSHYIYAVETGLSSDPAMNWRIAELENRSIISSSDAHSPLKLGREATIFKTKNSNAKAQNHNSKLKINYQDIYDAVSSNSQSGWEIGHTIEFYPEEGKYHYTGHRKCGVVYSPNETRKKGMACPVCGKQLTGGVMSRVESLATQEIEVETEIDSYGVQWVKDKNRKRPSYTMLVPLVEIIAEALSVGVGSKTVMNAYEHLISSMGSEFNILLETPIEELERITDVKIAEGIKKVRSGNIVIEPGYDGVFGKVKIWREDKKTVENKLIDQSTLF